MDHNESTNDVDNRRGPMENKADGDGPTVVTWRMCVSSVFEIAVTLGVRSFDIGRQGLRIAPTGERAVFQNGMLIFIGTTATWLALSIRIPAGNMRVLWNGKDIVIENRYLLTANAFVIRYTSPDTIDVPPIIFIDCFGRREARLHMRHHSNTYVLRFESDYSVVVVPTTEYLMVQLTLLRDARASTSNHRIELATERARSITPQTPPVPTNDHHQSSESEYEDEASLRSCDCEFC